MGPESLRTGTRPVPQYGTRIRDRGPARPAIAIWKSEMCALGRRVLINAQIAAGLRPYFAATLVLVLLLTVVQKIAIDGIVL